MYTQALELSQITILGWHEVYQPLHYMYRQLHTHTHTHLALLVAVGQQLQTVCGDGQELGVALIQQGNHLLQAVGQTNGHLSSFLVQQQVVERGDGIEEHRLHGRAEGDKQVG